MSLFHGVKIAYLISQYPAVSHTFILREILLLRHLGFEIETASINNPDRKSEKLTDDEKKEATNTYYIKSAGILQAFFDCFTTLFTNPVGFIKGLWFSLKLGETDLKRILWGFFYFIEAMMLGQWMNRTGCIHVHVHFANPASTVALIVTKIFPHTFSFTIHGPDVFYGVNYNYLTEKVAGAKFVPCISHYARSQLMLLSPENQWDKLHVCHLGIDPEKYKPVPEKKQGSPIRLLCVGRLVAAKGQHLLLEAIKKLKAIGYSIELEFVGDGPDRQSLEKEAKEKNIIDSVVFHGALNTVDTYQVLSQGDVFVLPSFAEGLPVSLMEAMSMEIPCITTQITGIPELIHNNKEGLLVSPSSVEELTKAIAQLIENPDLRVQMGKRGRSRILQDYDLKSNVRKLADIFIRSLNIKLKE